MTPLICAICHEAPATKPDADPSVCRRCYADLGELVNAPGGVALGNIETPLTMETEHEQDYRRS